MEYRLQDLVDINVLQKLLDRLHDMVPLSSSVQDLDGNVIVTTRVQDICRGFHKVNGVSRELCRQSDRTARATAGINRKCRIYTCPHGLVDSVTPIIIGGSHIATLISGQVFLGPPDLSHFSSQAKLFGFNEGEYIEALRQVPVITKEDLNGCLDLFGVFTGMLGELGIERLRELEAREALRQSNEKLRSANDYNRSLIEASIDAMAVIAPDGSIVDVNRAMERMTGRSRHELAGSPGKLLSFMDISFESPLGMKPGEFRLTDFETAIRHRDGHLTPVQVNATVYADESGLNGGLLFSAHDLTKRKWNEEQISRAEQYRLLADNSTDVIVRLTPEGICTYVSPACKKVLGYEPEEILGQSILNFFYPDDRLNYLKTLKTINANSRQAFVFNFRARVKDNGYIWFEASGQTFFDKHGEPIEVQVAVRDISKRKDAEEALRKSSDEISDLYHNAPCGYHSIGGDELFLRVNDTELTWLGYTREEMVGRMRMTDIMTPESGKKYEENRKTLLTTGRLTDVEAELVRKDGTMLQVLINSIVQFDEKGNYVMSRSTMNDITERKHAGESLKRSEEQYRLLTENSTDVITRMDAHSNVLYVSPSLKKVMGLEPTELVGHVIYDIVHPDDRAKRLKINEQMLARKEPVSFTCRYRRKDGSYLWIETVAHPELNGAGEVEEIHASGRDVTERMRVEEELRRAKEYAEEIINTATAIMLVMDVDCNIVEFNHAAEKLTGYRKAELLGRCWFETVVPKERYPEVWQKFSDLPSGNFPSRIENPIITKAGEEKHIVWNTSLLRTEGRTEGIVCFGVDVTERIRMENELKTYKDRLDIVLKNVDAAIFQVNRAGVYTLAEGRALSRAGRPRRETLGRLTETVLAGNLAALNAARQALAGKRASAEYTVGDTVFEEIFTPYTGPDGKPDGVIALAVDITERKKAEQSLYEEKERLRVTLQSIGDGVIATDGEGRVALMNGVAEEMTGWKSHQAIGLFFNDIFDLYNETTGEKCSNPVQKVLATGKIVGLGNHTALRSKAGGVRSIADSAAPILDSAHRILGVILVFRDVTDAKKKEGEITYLSYHDRLTGLYNRAFLEEEQRRLDTERQLPISVIMGDVNGLKLTNDVFGHAEGDSLLVRIGHILHECCRNEDIVARVGGDEFCILLPKTGYASAADICKRIYARCDKEDYGGPTGRAKLSISLGFSTKSDAGDSLTGVTKAAEDLMYRRKLLESRSQHSFIISSIRMTLFEKSFETEQHAQRLIVNSKAIAMALNLSDDQINDIELFALLHDIGKIAIDSRILTKPGPLDDVEWMEMRRHPEIGFRIAQASPELAHIAEYILCHHERWDGSGYPQGLKGTAIPLLARIMLVVDAYDAMTQDRVYRKALSRDMACTELLKNAGTQFDPNIVWVFMECLEHEGHLA